MKLAKHGKREWFGGGLIALALAATGAGIALFVHLATGVVIAVLAGTAWLALAAFFRVPNRAIPSDPGLILSPADGVVKDIEVTTDHGIELYEGKPLLCIGIFLSVLDVHVNRAPCDLQVEYRKYKEGRFLDARNPRCAKENESLVIAGTAHVGGDTFPVAVRQVSGAIARRIVCEPQPGARLKKGEIYGMIKFGSRTELYLPTGELIIPAVEIGQKVRSGTTVMARTKN
ncbi:phosphatidylserine decarboxylase [Pontiella sulfatireligans]|uniref:Phosphatidylserine decarboxylase proenzyme n=1 Tax=Pontiella sulfatireligans TaxID=2750658 RepID=A0A6C2UR16_9BACT|nr:phosphatidylserine decarboxylase [Pontiella sulfatireligans]VGO22752.1 Phosphatidylserine decarboxylase proenzyme [Pontiella sulfatireligans]